MSHIEVDDLTRPAVHALLQEHLDNMLAIGPPESVHALDLAALRRPEITFWTAWEGDRLQGCGALKELDATHGEVKSMRTPAASRRTGAGRALLEHIISTAKARGYRRLSLETGSMAEFAPSHRLHESVGFVDCAPFAEYRPDPNSRFLTLVL